jgi:hypothetical protein
MKLQEDEEKKVEMVEFPLELSDEEANRLYEYGLSIITKDKAEIINYAVNNILRRCITDTENNIKTLERLKSEKDIKEKKKNG